MYPTNQIILGGDSMFNQFDDIDAQIQRMETYRNRLRALKEQQTIQTPKLIWDEIDAEINLMTTSQKEKLFMDEQYASLYNAIQEMVNAEIINLVKGRIESSTKGKDLLVQQLQVLKKLKTKIVEDTDREVELFTMFKEYSKTHPEATYEEFIKSRIK